MIQIKKQSEKIEIVQLSPEDWLAYKNLRLRALKEEPAAFSTPYEEMVVKEDDYWKKRLADASKGENSWLLFAKRNTDLVGMISANTSDQGNTQIHAVFVVAEARGLGIGSLLMEGILKVLSAKKEIAKIYLDVNSQQPAAVGLYQKYGFSIVDEFDDLLVDGSTYKNYVMFRKNE